MKNPSGDSAPAIEAEGSRQRGALSIFSLIITLAIIVFFGGIVDFSQKLQARHEATIAAEEAARAGATQVDAGRAYTRGGPFVIDQAAAVHAADDYLRSGGYTGSVTTVGSTTIEVRVRVVKPAIFLPIIGINHLAAEATATADLTSGVRGENR